MDLNIFLPILIERIKAGQIDKESLPLNLQEQVNLALGITPDEADEVIDDEPI